MSLFATFGWLILGWISVVFLGCAGFGAYWAIRHHYSSPEARRKMELEMEDAITRKLLED